MIECQLVIEKVKQTAENMTKPRNIIKVWWKILRSFVGKFHPLSSSERILKIG